MKSIILIPIVFLCLPLLGQAQTEGLSGRWEFQPFFVEGTDYSLFQIESNGNVSVNETITRTLDGQARTFDVHQMGKVSFSQEGYLIYRGTGTDMTETLPVYSVLSTAAATGIVGPATNFIAGLWMENQTFTQDLSPVDVLEATPIPFIMIREDFEPGTPGSMLEGEWNASLNSQALSINWSGTITLNEEGTVIGRLGNTSLPEPNRAAAGFFTIDEEGNFSFSLITSNIIPPFGEVTMHVSGNGTVNAERNQIQGTWTITIATITQPSAKTTAQNTAPTQFLSGTFSMQRKQASFTPHWDIFR